MDYPGGYGPVLYNPDSILMSTKKRLGIQPDFSEFDAELIGFVNGALARLQQVGIGPKAGYSIADDTGTWTAFMGTDNRYNEAKDYVYYHVRNAFDPPQNSFVMTAYQNQMNEILERLIIARDEVEADNM